MAVSSDHYDKWSTVFILTDQMNTAKKSRIDLYQNPCIPRTRCINLVLNLTSYDSCSALMLFTLLKSSEANENPRIISSNPTHLKQKSSHHRMRKVLQLEKKLVYSANPASATMKKYELVPVVYCTVSNRNGWYRISIYSYRTSMRCYRTGTRRYRSDTL